LYRGEGVGWLIDGTLDRDQRRDGLAIDRFHRELGADSLLQNVFRRCFDAGAEVNQDLQYRPTEDRQFLVVSGDRAVDDPKLLRGGIKAEGLADELRVFVKLRVGLA